MLLASGRAIRMIFFPSRLAGIYHLLLGFSKLLSKHTSLECCECTETRSLFQALCIVPSLCHQGYMASSFTRPSQVSTAMFEPLSVRA